MATRQERSWYINGVDAYSTYGVTLAEGALSALFSPPANKDYVSNTSRLANGKSVIVSSPKVADRDVTLNINLTARNDVDFKLKYEAFCALLAQGVLNISTSYDVFTTFHFVYISCSQYQEFSRGIAKFTLKLNEPDPTNRT